MSSDWSSSPSAAAYAPAMAGYGAAGTEVAVVAPTDSTQSVLINTLANVLNAVRESVPTSMVRTVGGAINRNAHLKDWGDAYARILRCMQSTGPLIHQSINIIAPPVFAAMQDGWKEHINRFLTEAEPFFADLNETKADKFHLVLRAMESIFSNCSVFKLQFPEGCTAPDGTRIPLGDITFLHIWRQGRAGIPRDQRIQTTLRDESDRVDILLAMKTMIRSASVISAASTQLTESLLDATSSFLDGRRITPDDIMRIAGQAQSSFDWRNATSLLKIAPILFGSIRGEKERPESQ
jgi:hypothetical protein